MNDVVDWIKWLSRNCWESGGKSNLRHQQARDKAIRAAILAGVRFPVDAFIKIGCEYADGFEGYYRLAIESGNRSAAVSIERTLVRRPFLWDGRRLYVGAQFWCGVYHWKVNSFAANGSYLNAENVTHYREPEKPEPIRKFELTDEPERPDTRPANVPKRRRWTLAELDGREKTRKYMLKQGRKIDELQEQWPGVLEYKTVSFQEFQIGDAVV